MGRATGTGAARHHRTLADQGPQRRAVRRNDGTRSGVCPQVFAVVRSSNSARHADGGSERPGSLLRMIATMDRPLKRRVVDVDISATSYPEVVGCCRKWIDWKRSGSAIGKEARYVCVTSVHGVIMAHEDLEVRGILNEADIAT